VAGFLGLASGAKMTDIQDAILNLRTQNTNLKAENETLKGKVTAFELKETAVQTAEANTLIEAALTDERISLESKPMWEQNFKDNHENAKRLLGLMSGKVLKLSDVPAGKDGSVADAGFKYQGKTFKELDRDNPALLANLKANQPAIFKQLFKADYGVEYTD
jgi:regulator of replication initiation timing